jgi:hypothetical protein
MSTRLDDDRAQRRNPGMASAYSSRDSAAFLDDGQVACIAPAT